MPPPVLELLADLMLGAFQFGGMLELQRVVPAHVDLDEVGGPVLDIGLIGYLMPDTSVSLAFGRGEVPLSVDEDHDRPLQLIEGGALVGFLIIYDRHLARLIELTEYPGGDLHSALRDRLRSEIKYAADPSVEVVVIGAESREHLEGTHSRYFPTVLSKRVAALG